jgi:di- and tripeptidase
MWVLGVRLVLLILLTGPQVWDLATLSLVARLKGHTGAVLAFQVVKERNWLISSSGDGTVYVWNTGTLSAIYVIHPPHDNVGDIFSLAWVGGEVLGLDIDDELGVRMGAVPARSRGRLFAGCQDTSIQVRLNLSSLHLCWGY